jgi:hypothetical protein
MCGRCERPICVKCMVSGPAGMRCPDCASLRGTHLYKVEPLHLVILTLIGIVGGAAGVAIINEIGWIYFVIFLSLAYGGAVGELMLRSIGRKHGPVVEITGTASFIIGGLLPLAFEVLIFHSFFILAGHWIALIALGIAASACFSRLKY